MNNEEKMHSINLKLNSRVSKNMLGALRLGLTLQNMCADMHYSSVNGSDPVAMRYTSNITYVIGEIQKQTGLNREDEYGGHAVDIFINDIWRYVGKMCKKMDKAHKELEKEECGRLVKIEQDLKKKLGRTPTQKEMIKRIEETN